MPPTEIDALTIKIETDARNTGNGIEKLAKSLEKLKSALSNANGLSGLATIANTVHTAAENVGDAPTKMVELANALSTLGKVVKSVKFPASLSDQIKEFGIAVRDNIDADISQKMTGLATGLEAIARVGEVKISSTIATQITAISAALITVNATNLSRISMLATALASLAPISGIRIPSNLGNTLMDLGTAAELLDGVHVDNFAKLADALRPLSEIGNIHLGSVLNQLERIPEVAHALETVNMDDFAKAIERLNTALVPLAQNLSTVQSGLSGLSTQVNRTVNATNRLDHGMNRATQGTARFALRLGVAVVAARRIGHAFAEMINLSNQYIENLNLFNASMGEYAAQAQRYAEHVGEIMGIDPSSWMRNQGVFMTLASGFGVASDRAYIMSQQLTQLGYDLSSFFNLAVEGEGGAMQKLQAGLSGELEPLRRLGFDLSEARLKAIALELGIKKTFNTMSQAEKSQLRYYAIMTQVTTAQGDMARTLNSPANQIRILQAQVTQCARAFGNIFIPILNQVLPVAIALAKVIRILASSIASLFGFELPEVDYSNIVGGIDDIGDAAGAAGGKAKKLKDYLMGFDELNVINPNDNSGGGGGSAGGLQSNWDWDLPMYDFLNGLVENSVDKWVQKFMPAVQWIQDHLDTIKAIAGAIAAGILEWSIATTFLSNVGEVASLLSQIEGSVIAVATGVVTVALSYKFTNDYLVSGKFGYLIAQALSTGLGAYVVGKTVERSVAKGFGAYAAGVTISLSGLVAYGLALGEMLKDGVTGEEIIAAMWGAAEMAIGAAIGLSKVPALVTKGVKGSEIFGVTFGILASIALMLAMQEEIKKNKAFTATAAYMLAGAAAMAALSLASIAKHVPGLTASELTGIGFFSVVTVGLLIAMADTVKYQQGFNDDAKGLLVAASLAGAGAMVAAAHSLGMGKILAGTIGFAVTATVGLTLVAAQQVYYDGGWSTESAKLMAGAAAAGSIAFMNIAKAKGWKAPWGALLGFSVVATVGLALTAAAKVSVDGGDQSWESLADTVGSSAAAALASCAAAKMLGLTPTGTEAALAFTLALTANAAIQGGIAAAKQGLSWTWLAAMAVTVTSAAISGALAASIFGFTAAGGLAFGAAAGLALAAIVTINAINANDELSNNPPAWGDVEATAAQIESTVKQMFTFEDITATIDLAKTTLSVSKQANDQLADKIARFSATIKKVEVGAELSKDALDDILVQLHGEDGKSGLIKNIQKSIKASTDVIEVGISLIPPVDSSGNPLDTAEIFTLLAGVNEDLNNAASEFGNALAYLLTKGFEEGLSDDEAASQSALIRWFTQMDKAAQQAQLSSQLTSHLALTLTDLNEDSFKNAVELFKQYKNDVTEQFTDLEIATKAALESQRAQLQLTADTYTATGKAVPDSIKNEIAALDALIAEIDFGQSLNAAIDSAIEPGRQQFIMALNRIFHLDQTEIMKTWTFSNINEWNFDADWEVMLRGTREHLTEALEEIFGDNYTYVMQAAEIFGITGWDLLSAQAQKDMYNAYAAAMGDEKARKLFEELGWDLGNVITKGVTSADYGKAGKTAAKLMTTAVDEAGGVPLPVTLKKKGWTDLPTWANKPDQKGVGYVEGKVKLTKDGWKSTSSWLNEAAQKGSKKVAQTIELVKSNWKSISWWANQDTQKGTKSVTQNVGIKLTNSKGEEMPISDYASTQIGDTPVEMPVDLSIISVNGSQGGGGSKKKKPKTVSELISTQIGDPVVQPVSLGKNWLQDTVGKWVNAKYVSGSVSQPVNLTQGWTGTVAEVIQKQANIGTLKLPVELEKKPYTKLKFTLKASPIDQNVFELAASGGMFATGQAFIAREAGPELVGTIGNKSAVANNDQIVESVSGGVRAANTEVVKAIYTLINAVEDKDMSVTIGDDEIGRANNRYQRKRGAQVNTGAFADSY